MAKKYLDDAGVLYFWGKLKAYFQEKLVSGTNIKTINNTSLLGSGNITISGGGTSPADLADYVVDQGTSGIWTYRKWNSGIAECWGTTAARSTTSWSAWGGIYIAAPYNTQDSYPSGLFISTPNCQATLNTSQGDFFLIKYSTSNAAGSKDKTNAYYVARGTNGSSGTTYSISYYAIGKWQ